MKEVRILTINDGKEEVLANGDYFYAETYPRTEAMVQEYLNDGWNLIHVMKDFNPAIQKEGNYTFYRGGITFMFEREV
ncbi:MAG: hypothetical protein IKS37_12280 [Solobacterium sp.]|nr:hypothetical protein [Solobacterium sp.]